MRARNSAWALVLGALAASCAQGPPSDLPEAVSVSVSPVTRADVAEELILSGRLVPRPEEDLTLAPQVAGRVVRLHVREGDLVPAGAVVATVDRGPFDEAERAATAALAKAREEEDVRARAAALTATLLARGIASAEERDNDRAALEAARAGRAEAEARLAQARRSQGWAELRAPFTAVVAQLFRHGGETVDGTPATPIARLLGVSAQEVSADASAADLDRVRIGDRAVARISASEAPGRIVRASRSVDPSSGVGEVRVRLERPLPVPLLAPVKVVVTLAVHPGVLTVPVAAVRRSEAGQEEVVVVEKNVAKARAVKTGLRSGGRVEIATGLDGSETVVVDSPLGLTDGMLLAPRGAANR